jgi:hypothetical protein
MRSGTSTLQARQGQQVCVERRLAELAEAGERRVRSLANPRAAVTSAAAAEHIPNMINSRLSNPCGEAKRLD